MKHLNNIVVENISEEIGKEIIAIFKKLGFRTAGFYGGAVKSKSPDCYYGVINYKFDHYNALEVEEANANVVTLEQLKSMILNKEKPQIPSQPKWMPLTIGKYEYHIYEEFEGRIYGRIKHEDGIWHSVSWHTNGRYYEQSMFQSKFDLVPYEGTKLKLQQEIYDLEKQLEEKKKLLK